MCLPACARARVCVCGVGLRVDAVSDEDWDGIECVQEELTGDDSDPHRDEGNKEKERRYL